MKRTKGFILAEILTGMVLQALFILVLCATFYVIVSFGTNAQLMLTARERGERVITYVDQRIRSAGLGMWRLGSSKAIRDALDKFTDGDNKSLYDLKLPVAVTWVDKNTFDNNDLKTASHKTLSGYPNVYCGNILTLLYTARETNTANNLNLLVLNNSSYDTATNKYIQKYDFMSGENEYYRKHGGYRLCHFYDGSNRAEYINSYAAMAGAGVPIYIKTTPNKSNNNDSNIELVTKGAEATSSDRIIMSCDELMYIECEKMFVEGDDTTDRNFKFRKLSGCYSSSGWEDKIPHEKVILELYWELDTATNILDLYVLSSGGIDRKAHERPHNWPKNARPSNWNTSDYRFHIVYVSRASWKLNNLKEGFTWN